MWQPKQNERESSKLEENWDLVGYNNTEELSSEILRRRSLNRL